MLLVTALWIFLFLQTDLFSSQSWSEVLLSVVGSRKCTALKPQNAKVTMNIKFCMGHEEKPLAIDLESIIEIGPEYCDCGWGTCCEMLSFGHDTAIVYYQS